MTFLKDTKQAIAPSRQPQTESRRFWLILGGGSIALHLVLLLGLRWMNFRATVATSSADLTSIELVELAPDAPGGEAIAPAEESPASALPASDRPAAPSAPAAPVPEIAIAPPVPELPSELPAPSTPSAEVTPAPTPTPTPSPLPSSAPAPTATPPEAIASPTPPTPPTPTPLPQTSGSGEFPTPNPNPSNPLPPPPPVTPGTADSSNETGGTANDLPEIRVSSEVTPVAPGRYIASLGARPIPPEVGRDFPAANAYPQPNETTFNFISDPVNGSACGIVTPDLFPFLGTEVEFLVRVDRDLNDPNIGRVGEDGITPLQGSGSDAYDAIAQCLLREWTFIPPATTATNEAPSSEVIVTLQINSE